MTGALTHVIYLHVEFTFRFSFSFMLCCLLQEKRLRDRQTETEESLQNRLEAARIDMELSKFTHSSPRSRDAKLKTSTTADSIVHSRSGAWSV